MCALRANLKAIKVHKFVFVILSFWVRRRFLSNYFSAYMFRSSRPNRFASTFLSGFLVYRKA
jgi:hypothetical protein